jgi:hypothetical protein
MYSVKTIGIDPHTTPLVVRKGVVTYSVEGDCYRAMPSCNRPFDQLSIGVSDAHFINPLQRKSE